MQLLRQQRENVMFKKIRTIICLIFLMTTVFHATSIKSNAAKSTIAIGYSPTKIGSRFLWNDNAIKSSSSKSGIGTTIVKIYGSLDKW